MRITIAGATSFIGRRMTAIAGIRPDIDLTLVVRAGSRIDAPSNAKIVECGMEDYKELGKLAGEGDVFIDLPWLGSRGADRQEPELQKFNYKCNLAAMESMAEAGYKVLVSAGSQAEYGQCHGLITEQTPLNANTEYGKYKVRLFHDTAKLAEDHGIRFIEPRYFSLYGPGDYEKTLIMSVISKMKDNRDVDLNECTQLWDYLYVDDAVEGVLKLCANKDAKGAYNFATGHYRQLKDFVLDIKEALNSKSNVRFGVVEYKGLYIDLMPVIDRLKKDAGWEYKTSFIDGIKKTAGLMEL